MTEQFITFETVSEPIDSDKEQLAAKSLFVRIVKALEAKAVRPLHPPEKWDSYGWYAEFEVGPARLNCIMQRSDEWLLTIESQRGFMDWLKGRRFESEINQFANQAVSAVEDALGVKAKLFASEAEFRAG